MRDVLKAKWFGDRVSNAEAYISSINESDFSPVREQVFKVAEHNLDGHDYLETGGIDGIERRNTLDVLVRFGVLLHVGRIGRGDLYRINDSPKVR